MSKNVAVFVDVANIFYAAKAAGIDIDYVTLLKAATAGRDFVRAYAYTGLDPENENQRQFHSFLARSGYKVISKDIRKYGDGRIKANLDIELVVDMMKTARNLDIAVVVSGDGDFAPAIRAVQEQGVRVEVISFRGNTSSDLIEVADLFTDIAQIARVEKGSARSGRRVAAEGDLSMTEVPEKETEGAPRRRRGGRTTRDGRPEPVAASGSGRASNLIVLPGERLSRGVGDEIAAVGEVVDGADLDETLDVAEGGAGEYAASDNGAAADGARRRRRRGGRGRGRGRGRDAEELVATGTGLPAGESDDEEEEFDELPPAQPPVQAFGSVWDSQIGVPSGTAATSAGSYDPQGNEDDEDLDEPEVPEYMLAERRQRGRQGANRGGGGRQARGRSAYQAALDRERYGNRAPQPSFGGSTSSQTGGRSDRGRNDRGRGGRPQQGGRTYDRAPRQDARPYSSEPRSAEPWSEVPPEVEEMLRAEMARKSPGTDASSTPRAVAEPETPVTAFSASPDDEPQTPTAKPARRTRSTKATAASATSADATADEAAAEEKPKRKTATRTTKSTSTRSKTTKASAAAEGAEESADAEAPTKPTRRRTTKAAAEAPPEES